MSGSISALQPDLQPFARQLVAAAAEAGLQPRVTSTLRSHAQQRQLYQRYLAGQQEYPVARPGTSAHEFGWAFDMVVTPMESLPDVGAYWEALGGVWGGNPRKAGSRYDPVHFEYPGWEQFVAPEEEEDSLGIFPFTRPSRLQRAGVTVASFIPGTAGYLATAAGLLTDYLFPER